MKNTLAASIIALGALSLASCTLEPYVITKEEEYMRNFIKEFGLVDSQQDWNQATSRDITVNVGKGAEHLKLYAKVGDTYYIIADYYDVEGEITIPVDVLEDTKDILAVADGRKYYGTVGTTINCTGAASRANNSAIDFPTVGELTTINYTYSVGSSSDMVQLHSQITTTINTNTTKTIDGKQYTVTAGYLTDESDSRAFEYFNAQQIAPITSDRVWRDYFSLNGNTQRTNGFTTNNGFGLIPESGLVPGYGNTHNPGITQNFTIKATDCKFAIYPMYWNSCQVHELGVYLYNENETDVLKDGDGKPEHFPIFIDKRKEGGSADLYKYNKESTIGIEEDEIYRGGSTEHGDANSDFLNYMPKDLLSDYFEEGIPKSQYFYTDSETGLYKAGTDFKTFMRAYVAAFNNPSNWTYFSDFIPDKYQGWRMVKFGCGNWGAGGVLLVRFTFENTASYPSVSDVASYLTEIGGTYEVAKINNLEDTSDDDCAAYPTHNPLRMKNRAYFVYLPEGYDRKFGMYIRYNDIMSSSGTERVMYSESRFNSATGTRDGEEYSYACSFLHPESARTFFSFEDWSYNGGSDKDLNDLVFRLANYDEITGDGSTITEISDEPISWIWAVEDLGSTDDFDFNDIVVKVTSVATKQEITTSDGMGGSTTTTKEYKKVTFEPLAAGGTLPTYLHWQKSASEDYVLAPGVYIEAGAECDESSNPEVQLLSTLALSNSASATDREYHQWFGGANYKTMINTGAAYVSQDKIKKCVIYVNNQFSISGFGLSKSIIDGRGKGLYISINGPTEGENTENLDITKASDVTYNVSAPQVGAPAQMFIILDNNWEWPLERHHISAAYPNFPAWITNKSIDWTTNCVSAEIFSR